ncbi:MAG: butyrate kinase [Cytophagales bacterium]|nr:butyrate kinase [Cytophagales bacterium]
MCKKEILVINPGSTSTKIAWFVNLECVFKKTLKHPVEELENQQNFQEKYLFRKNAILSELAGTDMHLKDLTMIVSRGGMLKPIESGVYEVNQRMLHDLEHTKLKHASNLGGVIAHELATQLNIKAYIADPVVVDELDDLARYSGHPNFERRSVFHALNQKAIARQHAREIGREYEELNLIGVHLGGGISVALHRNGRVVDVNQALDGEGAMSPERSGTLPAGELIRMAYSGKYTQQEMMEMVVGKGGFVAYTGTNDGFELSQKALSGDKDAQRMFEVLAYQVAKEIGALAAVNAGKIDTIFLTGGMAHNKDITRLIRERVEFIAPVKVFPGEDEMHALAQNGYMLLEGRAEAKEYV